jgi:hypothetical protein
VRIDWTDGFDRYLTRLEDEAATGDHVAVTRLDHVAALLDAVRELPVRLDVESATFKRVRQARRTSFGAWCTPSTRMSLSGSSFGFRPWSMQSAWCSASTRPEEETSGMAARPPRGKPTWMSG